MRFLLSVLLVTATVVPAFAVEIGRNSHPAPEETARRESPVKKFIPASEANEEMFFAPAAGNTPVEAAPAAEKQPEMPEPVGAKPVLLTKVPVEIVGQTGLPETSLVEVLVKSYGSSPTLRAERERLRIQYEDLAQADALAFPVIDIDGGAGLRHSEDKPGSKNDDVTRDVGLTLVQPVWSGGRITSYIEQQERLTSAQIAAYEGVAQTVFLNVVSAATDIMRDRAVIALNEKNRELIAEQLKSAENAFKVGSATRTDVAQAKARLSEADANLAAAKAAYASSLARYRQYAGMEGESTSFDPDTTQLNLPGNLEGAQSLAATDNPEIVYAQHLESAADEAVTVAAREAFPSLSLVGNAGHDWHAVSGIDESRSATLALRASMNLYEGGAMNSRIRQAKFSKFEREQRVEEARRSVTQQVATAWNNHQAALAAITALKAQVEAATIARNGVYKEREVGTRTFLDALDAERELLNAEVGLAQAERDSVIADYALLAATGQLTPSRLGMMSPETERRVMEKSRGLFVGTSVQPRD